MKLYTDLAEVYDLLYSYRDYDREAQFLLGNLPQTSGSRILDVGCGTGSHLASIRKALPDARLAGVDLNGGMLNVARRKGLNARLEVGDMRDFDLEEQFDLAYCLSSSIQYNLTEDDLKKTLGRMRQHTIKGLVIFDLAFCKERWKEGYTNITASANEDYQVAELFTSHSRGDVSSWNPLYLVKDNRTGEMDMHVDSHTIRVWSVREMEEILRSQGFNYGIERGFDGNGGGNDIPLFVLTS